MNREFCVICNAKQLETFYILKQYPVAFSPPTLSFENDQLGDFKVGGCLVCGCAQLQTLTDPVILYENAHNLTFDTPSWKLHHESFASYILSSTDTTSFLEVGGVSGVLVRHILPNRSVKYTILDLCPDNPNIDGVKFIVGNCEEFDYTGHSTLILSHVFEHLYEPIRFINKIKEYDVQDVFISIPNMQHQLDTGNIRPLHCEHTYFCNDYFIKYLFSTGGYRCHSFFYFKNHSIFYHFKKDEFQMTLENQSETLSAFKSMVNSIETRIKSIVITTPSFIAPAGHYGQMLYYYLKDYKDKIIGFLDNDPSKIGRRVYGCDKSVMKPAVLKEYDGVPITIIIYAGPYLEEIKEQYMKLHSQIIFISV
jgi:hypothetical protein